MVWFFVIIDYELTNRENRLPQLCRFHLQQSNKLTYLTSLTHPGTIDILLQLYRSHIGAQNINHTVSDDRNHIVSMMTYIASSHNSALARACVNRIIDSNCLVVTGIELAPCRTVRNSKKKSRNKLRASSDSFG